MKIQLLSENTVIVLGEQVISDDNFTHISQLHDLIQEELSEYLVDCIPSYASVHITVNLLRISLEEFLQKLELLVKKSDSAESKHTTKKVIEVPVYYGLDVALDLEELAENTGLSTDEVIQTHSEKMYNVYSIGFSPGFAFLGSVDKKISMARKATPRTSVPKGSVGIADSQTAIYPLNSPGGWQIIGRTPIELINYFQQPITPLAIGDEVKFSPISQSEFLELGGSL